MVKLNIKPLSVNQAWKGKRYRSDKYKAYKTHVLLLLKPMKIPKGKLRIDLEFGFSSKNSDIDNPVKGFLDCLQAKYGFNDSKVYYMTIKKVIVPSNEDYIKFDIKEIQEDIKQKIKQL